jgi:hypothetical protein
LLFPAKRRSNVSKDEEFTNVKMDKIPTLNAVFSKEAMQQMHQQ